MLTQDTGTQSNFLPWDNVNALNSQGIVGRRTSEVREKYLHALTDLTIPPDLRWEDRETYLAMEQDDETGPSDVLVDQDSGLYDAPPGSVATTPTISRLVVVVVRSR